MRDEEHELGHEPEPEPVIQVLIDRSELERMQAEIARLKAETPWCACGDQIVESGGGACGTCHSMLESERDRLRATIESDGIRRVIQAG